MFISKTVIIFVAALLLTAIGIEMVLAEHVRRIDLEMNKTIAAIHYDDIPMLRTASASTTLREIQETKDQPLIKKIASAILPSKSNDTHTSPETPCPPSGISEQYRCYRAYYSNMVSKISVERAIKDLRTRYDAKDIFAVTQCHQLIHMIGRAAVDKYPTVSEAYTHGDAICWSGYYHGVMEGVMARIGRDNITAHMNDICADIPGKVSYSFDYYNCVHGLGHGVMYVKNNELFSSLDICDTLIGDWEKSSCIGGVFMENVIVDNLNHFTKYLKTDDPVYPCNAVDEKYKQPCYLMQTSYMLKLMNYDFARIFDICAGIESKYVDTCYQSLGRDASGQSISNVEKTRATCLLGKDARAQENCVIGAVKDFVAYHHSDVQAKQLCATFPTDQLRNTCDATAKSYYKAF